MAINRIENTLNKILVRFRNLFVKSEEKQDITYITSVKLRGLILHESDIKIYKSHYNNSTHRLIIDSILNR